MSLVRGRDFSVLLQKVKNKIQNDLTDHLSASQSVNEGISINFKQSKQCFNALKCLKIVFSKWLKIVLMLIPGPLVDRTFSSQVFKSLVQQISFSRSLVQQISFSRSNALKCQWAIKTNFLMLTPGPLNRTFSSQVFKLVQQKQNNILHVLRVGPHRGHGLQCYASIIEDQVSPCSVRLFDYLNICRCERHIISIIALLLLCGDIESNPGPVTRPFLKVASINCRGLTDKVKFLSTISKLKRECKTDEHAIFCLQEVHQIDLSLLSVIWDDAAVSLSSCARNSRGTLILGKGDFTIVHEVIDINGRFNIVKLSYTHDLVQSAVIIANVYAPNDHKESLVFFKDIFLFNLKRLLRIMMETALSSVVILIVSLIPKTIVFAVSRLIQKRN